MAEYQQLQTTHMPDTAQLDLHRLPELVHLNDPAISVLYDFRLRPPTTILDTCPMDDALSELKILGLHWLLVINEQDQLCGIISSEDLLGEKPLQLIHNKGIERHKVCVKQLMIPLKNIHAFSWQDMQHAQVGHIVVTLQKQPHHFSFVVSEENNNSTIYGLFDLSHIARQLHTKITNKTSINSLYELKHIQDS